MGLALGQVPPPRNAEVLIQKHQALKAEAARIRANEATQLKALAEQLQGEAAEAVQGFIEGPPPRNGPVRFVPLPEVVSGEAMKPDVPEEVRKVRAGTATKLYDLAKRAAAANTEFFALADRCLRGVIDRDPGHREARRLLGYVAYKGGWAKPQAKENLQAGKVLHSTFGWVDADWVPHLEKGELPGLTTRGRSPAWLPADEANSLRAENWSKGWKISTEHFFIQTNVPLSEAIAFGRRLEALHDVFFSHFADLIGPTLPLAKRFHDPKLCATPTPPRARFQVYYFASKDEYVQFFRDRFRLKEELSLGYYMPLGEAKRFREDARSYFYRDPGNPISANETLFHEASHQVLFETRPGANIVANHSNFWVWEGLGTYFETFVPQEDGSYTIGGLVGPRIAKAHDDIVTNGQLVPTAQLVALDKDQFVAEPGVYLNYAESMALAVFLLDGEHGRYREAFLSYVEDAYRGKAQTKSALSRKLGIPYDALDQALVGFLAEGMKGP
jgi:hypothetical protein